MNFALRPGPMMAATPGAHPQIPLTHQQMEAQRQQRDMATEQAKRRAKRPTDKTMPDGVEDVIIGDGVQRYKELRDFERRLDATMTRKRLDIMDSVNRYPKVSYKRGQKFGGTKIGPNQLSSASRRSEYGSRTQSKTSLGRTMV
jgi:hypothetical protein